MKKKIVSSVPLFLIAIVLGLAVFTENERIGLLVLFITIVSAFYNRYLSLAVYVLVSFAGISLNSAEVFGELLIVSVIGVSLLGDRKRRKSSKVKLLLIMVISYTVAISLSSFFHISVDLVSITLYVFKLLLMVIIAQAVIEYDEKIFLYALLLSAAIVSLITTYHFYAGDVDVYSETQSRLTYNGNIKDLATATALPVLFFLDKLLNYKNSKSKIELVFIILLFLGSLSLLLLTYARGVLIGLSVATFCLIMLYTTKHLSFSRVLLYTFGLFAVLFFIENMELSSDLMFSNVETGGGRTPIYELYMKFMENQGDGTLILGMGSGDIQAAPDVNPHSVILAHYFYYGILGALFILCVLGTILHSLFKHRKSVPFYYGLFLMTTIMYMGHGSYGDPRFWLIMGLCSGIAFKNEYVNKSLSIDTR